MLQTDSEDVTGMHDWHFTLKAPDPILVVCKSVRERERERKRKRERERARQREMDVLRLSF